MFSLKNRMQLRCALLCKTPTLILFSLFPLLSFPLRAFDSGAVYISGEYFNLVPVK
jgi:hypothetical protein